MTNVAKIINAQSEHRATNKRNQAAQRAVIEALTTTAGMIGDSMVTLEAASIQLVRTTLEARKAGFKDVKAFKEAVDGAFAMAIEQGKMGAKAAANYRGYMGAVFTAVVLPKNIENLALQAANKAVREANPGLFQTRAPRPGSNTDTDDEQTGDALEQTQKITKAGDKPGSQPDPLDVLATALNVLAAQTDDEVALDVIASMKDLAAELFELFGVKPLETAADAA